ncbi:MAG: NUDIX domain-containing protein [Spirochaetia bacterium]|nr:NUDIX domain-containing protein [Spirochaetia bacterium]
MPNRRIRIAGIFIQNKSLLLVKHKKNNKEYFLLPGGAQENGESMTDALKREWEEELSVKASIGECAFIGESIPPNGVDKNHILQFVFQIKSFSGVLKVNSDGTLIDFAWIPLINLEKTVLFPDCATQIIDFLNNKRPCFYKKYKWI